MARVQEVVLRQTPPAPGEYGTKMDALEANPEEVVVDARFARRKSVEDAAFRVNSGKRRDWPNDRFYACWGYNVEGVGETQDDGPVATMGRWELLIGDKQYMPEAWRPVVEAPGSRRRRRAVEDTFGKTDEVESYEDAA